MPEPTVTVETPAADANTFSLTEYRAGKTSSETNTPAKSEAVATPVVDDAPDPEVDADPEFRAAVDDVEKPKDNETPQEKAARTRRNKETARRGWHTRMQNKAARLERENAELRQRAAMPPPPPDRTQTPPVSAHQPAVTAETDPNDPEPSFDSWAAKHTLDAFVAAHPNHPDPYAAYVAEFNKEWSRWDRRQEQRQADSKRREETQRQQAQRVGATVQAHRDAGSAVHPDFETTLHALGTALKGHPADEVIAVALGDITDPKIGSEVLYRLGKNFDETRAAVQQGERALLRHIGRLEAAITAERAKPASASPVVTSAPPPHTPVGATAQASALFSVKGSEVDIVEYRRAQKEGRLPAELR
jgi:hypothetical protein